VHADLVLSDPSRSVHAHPSPAVPRIDHFVVRDRAFAATVLLAECTATVCPLD
jgi:hypothetical protein